MDQLPNVPSTQSTGHGCALHVTTSSRWAHGMPPCLAAVTMERLRVCAPPPHDFVHVVHKVHVDSEHGTGGSHSRSLVVVGATFSYWPDGHGVMGVHSRLAAECGAAFSYSSSLQSVCIVHTRRFGPAVWVPSAHGTHVRGSPLGTNATKSDAPTSRSSEHALLNMRHVLLELVHSNPSQLLAAWHSSLHATMDAASSTGSPT